MSATKPKVYLAGKIGHNDWRHEIVSGLRNLYSSGLGERNLYSSGPGGELFNPDLAIDCGDYLYGGPFFVSCDHGCAHGPTAHGVGITGNAWCIETWADSLEARRSSIFAINHTRLLRADWVFAYIESPDCHGTLLELGMAYSSGIPIAIAFAPGFHSEARDEFWMAEQMSSCPVLSGFPTYCWQRFYDDQLLRWQGGVTIDDLKAAQKRAGDAGAVYRLVDTYERAASEAYWRKPAPPGCGLFFRFDQRQRRALLYDINAIAASRGHVQLNGR